MRIAVAGKGGSGKTTVAGTLARLLARAGQRVVAVDADCGPTLGLALGVPPDRLARLPTLRDGGRERTGDGVELVVMGAATEAGAGCLTPLNAAVRELLRVAPEGTRDVCILDTDATAEGFARGVARHADTVLLVAEPFRASLETARRMAALARDLGVPHVVLAANKVREGEGVERVRALAAAEDLPLVAVVPWDPAVEEAERAARAPLDAAPDGPAVRALAALARALATQHAPRARPVQSGS